MSFKRFFEMLERVPRIKHLWNEKRRALDVELLEKELAVMSPGEIHMAKFFAAVWFSDNSRYGFDLIDAAAYIDQPERVLIINWMADPFWP